MAERLGFGLPEAENLTEGHGGYKKFGFSKCFGEEGRSTVSIQVRIYCV